MNAPDLLLSFATRSTFHQEALSQIYQELKINRKDIEFAIIVEQDQAGRFNQLFAQAPDGPPSSRVSVDDLMFMMPGPLEAMPDFVWVKHDASEWRCAGVHGPVA